MHPRDNTGAPNADANSEDGTRFCVSPGSHQENENNGLSDECEESETSSNEESQSDSDGEDAEENDDGSEKEDEDDSDDDDDDESEEDDDGSVDESQQRENDPELAEDHDSDSSDGQSERCPICLNRFMGQEIGTPESCDHSFCFECISEWSKNMNTCPVDRRTFAIIFVRNTLLGKIIRQVKVQCQKTGEMDDEDDLTHCEVCGRSDREDRLLLCDGCDMGFHLDCLNPPLADVPVEEWFCPECDNENRQNLAEEMDIEEGEVTALIDDGETGLATSRLRTRAETRLLPRTRQSERVRRRIQRSRATRTHTVDIDQPSTSNTEAPEVRRVIRPKRKPAIRRTKPKRRRKTVKKRRKVTRKRKTPKTKSGSSKRRRKGRRRKKKAKRPLLRKMKTLPISTTKTRLAEQLGVKKMLPNHFLPVMRAPGSARGVRRFQSSSIPAPTFRIFGHRDDLDDLIDGYDEGSEGGMTCTISRTITNRSDIRKGGLSALARLSHRPVSTRVLSDTAATQSSSPTFDVLGSILNGQNLTHANSRNVQIRRDGTLSVFPSGSSWTVRQRPTDPTHGSRNSEGGGGEKKEGSVKDSGSSGGGGGGNPNEGYWSRNYQGLSSASHQSYSDGCRGDGGGGEIGHSGSDSSVKTNATSKHQTPNKKQDKRGEKSDSKKVVDEDDIDIYSDIETGFENDDGNDRTMDPIGSLNEMELVDGGSSVSPDLGESSAMGRTSESSNHENDALIDASDDDDDDLVIDESVKHDEEDVASDGGAEATAERPSTVATKDDSENDSDASSEDLVIDDVTENDAVSNNNNSSSNSNNNDNNAASSEHSGGGGSPMGNLVVEDVSTDGDFEDEGEEIREQPEQIADGAGESEEEEEAADEGEGEEDEEGENEQEEEEEVEEATTDVEEEDVAEDEEEGNLVENSADGQGETNSTEEPTVASAGENVNDADVEAEGNSDNESEPEGQEDDDAPYSPPDETENEEGSPQIDVEEEDDDDDDDDANVRKELETDQLEDEEVEEEVEENESEAEIAEDDNENEEAVNKNEEEEDADEEGGEDEEGRGLQVLDADMEDVSAAEDDDDDDDGKLPENGDADGVKDTLDVTGDDAVAGDERLHEMGEGDPRAEKPDSPASPSPPKTFITPKQSFRNDRPVEEREACEMEMGHRSKHRVASGGESLHGRRSPLTRFKKPRGSRDYEEGEIVDDTPPRKSKSSSSSRKSSRLSRTGGEIPSEYEEMSRVNIAELPRIPKIKRDSRSGRDLEATNSGCTSHMSHPASSPSHTDNFLAPNNPVGSGGGGGSASFDTKRSGVMARLDSSSASEISWKKLSQNTKTRNYRDGKAKLLKPEQKYYRVREMKENAERRAAVACMGEDSSRGSRRGSEAEKDKRKEKERGEAEHYGRHGDAAKEWQRGGREKPHEKFYDKSHEKLYEKAHGELRDKTHGDLREKSHGEKIHEKRSSSSKYEKDRHREKHREKHKSSEKHKEVKDSKRKHSSGAVTGATSRNREASSSMLERSSARDRNHERIAADKAEKRERKEQKKEKIRKELERIHREEKHREHKRREKEKANASVAATSLVAVRSREASPIESKEVYASGDSIIVNVNFSRPTPTGKENASKDMRGDEMKSSSLIKAGSGRDKEQLKRLDMEPRDMARKKQRVGGDEASIYLKEKGVRNEKSSRKRELEETKKDSSKRSKYDDSRPLHRAKTPPSRWKPFGDDAEGASTPPDADQKSVHSDSPIIIQDDEPDTSSFASLEDDDVVEILPANAKGSSGGDLQEDDDYRDDDDDDALQSPNAGQMSDRRDDFCNYDSMSNDLVQCSPPSPAEDASAYDPFEPTKSPSSSSLASEKSPLTSGGKQSTEKLPELPPPLPELPPLPPEPEEEEPFSPKQVDEKAPAISPLTVVTSSSTPSMALNLAPLQTPPAPLSSGLGGSSGVPLSKPSPLLSQNAPPLITNVPPLTPSPSSSSSRPLPHGIPPMTMPNIRVPPPNFIPRSMPPNNSSGNAAAVPMHPMGWPVGTQNLLFPPSQPLLRGVGNFLTPPPPLPTAGGSGSAASAAVPTSGTVTLTQIGTLLHTQAAQLAMLAGVRPPSHLHHHGGGNVSGVPPPVAALTRHPPPLFSLPPTATSSSSTNVIPSASTQNGDTKRSQSQHDTTEVMDMDVDSPYSPGDTLDPSDPFPAPAAPMAASSANDVSRLRDRFDTLLGSVQSRKENVPAKGAVGMDKGHFARNRGHTSGAPSKGSGNTAGGRETRQQRDDGRRRSSEAQQRGKHIVRFEVPDRQTKGVGAAGKGAKDRRTDDAKKEVTVKMDETQLKILDELPSSAVEMQVKEKFLKKLNRQERVIEEVKLAIKPYYNRREINKDEYKEILRKSVPKICHNKSGEINPVKIKALVEGYVKKFRYHRKKEVKGGMSKKS